jgi:hypothetical protein
MSPDTSGTVEGLFQNLARGYSIQRNSHLALVFVPFPDAFLLNPRLNLNLNPIASAKASGTDAAGLGGR